jgi:hypothetical protein
MQPIIRTEICATYGSHPEFFDPSMRISLTVLITDLEFRDLKRYYVQTQSQRTLNLEVLWIARGIFLRFSCDGD